MRKRSSKFSGVTFEWKTSCFVFKHSQFGFVKNEKTDCICVWSVRCSCMFLPICSWYSNVHFREFMEGQREYLRQKQLAEEMGSQASKLNDVSKLKEKVGKLMKMRKLAKMAQVLDSSTVRRILPLPFPLSPSVPSPSLSLSHPPSLTLLLPPFPFFLCALVDR